MWCRTALRAATPVVRRAVPRRLCTSTTPAAEASSSGTTIKEAVADGLDWYMHQLTEYPMRTNAAVAGVLCTIGDSVAQYSEFKLGITSPDKNEYNWKRTLRMAFWGSAICGPLLCLWYRGLHAAAEGLRVSYAPVVSGRFAALLERTPAMQWITELQKPTVVPMTSTQLLLGKVAIDTMIFQAPFLNLYFSVMGLLEGLSLHQIYEKTRASFHRAWALSLLVWTPVQLLNLHFVPLPLQPCVVATVNVGWQTTLSILNHYHEYGHLARRASDAGADDSSASATPTPRSAASPPAQPPPLHAPLHLQPHLRPGQAGSPPPAGWELERAQLRARIAQLLAENKTLRLQLGQMHAATYGSASAAATPAYASMPANAQTAR